MQVPPVKAEQTQLITQQNPPGLLLLLSYSDLCTATWQSNRQAQHHPCQMLQATRIPFLLMEQPEAWRNTKQFGSTPPPPLESR